MTYPQLKVTESPATYRVSTAIDGFISVTLSEKFMSRSKYIGSDAIAVFVYLCSRINLDDCWNHNVLECWPSLRDIQENIQLSKNKVMKAVDKLEFLGYLSIGRSLKKANHYSILPGIEDEREFLLRFNAYCKRTAARLSPASHAWPLRYTN